MTAAFNARVSEVKEIVAMLDEEHDDIEDLARAVINKTLDLVFDRGYYTLVVQNSQGVFSQGPYFTRKQAENARDRFAEPGPDRSTYAVTLTMKNS